MSGFSRRTLLYAATAAATVLPQAGIANAPSAETAQWRALARRLLPHRDSAQAIGKEFLAYASQQDAARLLTSAIVKLSSLRGMADDAEILHAAIRTDHANARTVRIGGWILSETEIALSLLSLDKETA